MLKFNLCFRAAIGFEFTKVKRKQAEACSTKFSISGGRLRMVAVEPVTNSADQDHGQRAHDDRHSEVDGGRLGITDHAAGTGP
jgi:hypothetical protein